MPNYEIDCPNCHTLGLIVETGFDHNYGADADGNRGMSLETIEITDAKCDCEINDDAVLWEAVKRQITKKKNIQFSIYVYKIMKEQLREFYASLYDTQFPGLEYEWIRLCERFKASFNFNFEGKSFNQILSEFAAKSLPFSMQNTITALQCRVLLTNAVAGPQELSFYAETLRKDLDEYTEGNEVHVIEILYCQTKVKVQVSLYPKDAAPQKRIIVKEFLEVLFEKESGIRHFSNSLIFVRKNDQFNFSNGFAQKDANEVIGFVLSEFKQTAEQLLEKIKIANANEKMQTQLK